MLIFSPSANSLGFIGVYVRYIRENVRPKVQVSSPGASVRLTGALRVDPDTAFAAQIILGEALANTVEHAPGMVEVAIECSDENLVITTRDHGPGFRSARRKLPDELDERGRGLFLMEALAAQLTVRSEDGGGTEMRAVVPLTRTRTSELMPARVL